MHGKGLGADRGREPAEIRFTREDRWEEKQPQSHLRVTDAEDTLYFEYAFWYPGSTRYFSCEATLSKGGLPGAPDPRPALAAFEKACRELARTYCSREDVNRASRACTAKLSGSVTRACERPGCTVPFVASRATDCTSGATYPSAASCASPVVNDCSFYRTCLEPAHRCGEDGYGLGFGERLCYTFLAHDDEFSPLARAWLSGVRQCLQRELVPLLSTPLSCGDVATKGYASHMRCYTAPEQSICALPLADVAHLTTLLGTDLITVEALGQVRDVALHCAVEQLTRAATASIDAEDRLGFYQGLAAAAETPESLARFLAASTLARR